MFYFLEWEKQVEIMQKESSAVSSLDHIKDRLWELYLYN